MKSNSVDKIFRLGVDEALHHSKHDPHRQASGLADIILGGQDGLVNVLGVILGVAADLSGDVRVVIAAGLAATFAESVSMGAVAYTSTQAEAEFYESEREREYRHIREVPNLEREEVRKIYSDKGFDGRLLERIVETITANQDIWVAVMMAEEHQLTPTDRRQSLRAALVVGFSAIIGSLIPLLPFAFLPVVPRMWVLVLNHRAGFIQRRRLQSPIDGWAADAQRPGNGGHRHAQRTGRLCCWRSAQTPHNSLAIPSSS